MESKKKKKTKKVLAYFLSVNKVSFPNRNINPDKVRYRFLCNLAFLNSNDALINKGSIVLNLGIGKSKKTLLVLPLNF